MARIFQSYVTPEGRSIVPPAGEPEAIEKDDPVDEKSEKPRNVLRRPKTAFSIEDLQGTGNAEKKDGQIENNGVSMESVKPMLAVLIGIRDLIQSIQGLAK